MTRGSSVRLSSRFMSLCIRSGCATKQIMERTTAGRNHCPPRKIDAEAVVGMQGAEDPVDGLRNLEQDAARTGRQGNIPGAMIRSARPSELATPSEEPPKSESVLQEMRRPGSDCTEQRQGGSTIENLTPVYRFLYVNCPMPDIGSRSSGLLDLEGGVQRTSS
mgnify:FL=1